MSIFNMVSSIKRGMQLRVFENRILRRIFEPKRDANGEWRTLHNEKLHSLYRSPKTVRVTMFRILRWAGLEARMDEVRCFKNFKRYHTPTEKRPLGRTRHRWEDNIKMNLKGIGINTRNWVDSAMDRDYWRALVNALFNLRVP